MTSSNPAAAEPPPDGEIVAATVPAQPSWWTAESSSAAADGTAPDDAAADSGATAHEPANHADGDNMAALSAGGWARWPRTSPAPHPALLHALLVSLSLCSTGEFAIFYWGVRHPHSVHVSCII